MSPGARDRMAHLAAATTVAGCGLAWRLAPLGLPPFWLKYGGSVLWGAMVLLIVGAVRPQAASTRAVAGLALLVSLASELLRLVHAPALDAFRLTLPGALLLGRVFSAWNILAYAVGIAAAMPLHQALCWGSGSRRRGLGADRPHLPFRSRDAAGETSP